MRDQKNVKKWFLTVPPERRLFTIEAYRAELDTYSDHPAYQERKEYLKECIQTMEAVVVNDLPPPSDWYERTYMKGQPS